MSADKVLISISLVRRKGQIVIDVHEGMEHLLGGSTNPDTAVIALELKTLGQRASGAMLTAPLVEGKPLKFKPLAEPLTEPDIPSPQELWRSERGL